MSEMMDQQYALHFAVHYRVVAEADPQSVLRLINLFAQLWLVPDSLHVRRIGDVQSVAITLTGIGEHSAEVIAGKMRSVPLVRSVSTEYVAGRQAVAAA